MKKRKCRICEEKHYAKGYCRNHYTTWLRNGVPGPLRVKNEGMACKIKGCDRPACVNGVCEKHYQRLRNTGSYEKKIRRGTDHWCWKGGLSEYPGHYTLKKNRLIKLRETGGKCEFCGAPANMVIHKDGSKSNHVVKNLTAVCRKCQGKNTRKRGKSKYKNIYGRIADMAAKMGVSEATLYKRLKNCLPVGNSSKKKLLTATSQGKN